MWYQRDFNDVTISMDDDQFNIEISRPKRSIDERLTTIWSRMGDELCARQCSRYSSSRP